MDKKEYFFNGKPLDGLSLVELREFESATVTALIVSGDKLEMTNNKLRELPYNTSLRFDKQLDINSIQRNELQLGIIKKAINDKMSNTWI